MLHLFLEYRKVIQLFIIISILNFYGDIDGLQCWVSFCHIAKWIRYTYTHIHSLILPPCRSSQTIEKSALCCTVGPYSLSISYIIWCMCQPQSPSSSLPPSVPHVCIYMLFHILFHYGLLQNIEYSSLYNTLFNTCLSGFPRFRTVHYT